MGYRDRPAGPRAAPAPLDPPTLERMALDYVARYATTRARVAAYLARKLRERGWAGEGEPDPQALAARMAEAGYVDDAGFALARAGALGRRGYGRTRVAAALDAAGIAAPDRAKAIAASEAGAWEAALAFARRRRIGPVAREPADAHAARRAVDAMLRAGHDYRTARRIVSAPPGEVPISPHD